MFVKKIWLGVGILLAWSISVHCEAQNVSLISSYKKQLEKELAKTLPGDLQNAKFLLIVKKEELKMWDSKAKANFKQWFGKTDEKAVAKIVLLIDRSIEVIEKITPKDFSLKEYEVGNGNIAHVYPKDQTKTIYLSEEYFKLLSLDRITTIIHEISHFLGTDDIPFTYGEENSLWLAKNNPKLAYIIAENFSYYITGGNERRQLPGQEIGDKNKTGNNNLMNENNPAKGPGGPTFGYDPHGKYKTGQQPAGTPRPSQPPSSDNPFNPMGQQSPKQPGDPNQEVNQNLGLLIKLIQENERQNQKRLSALEKAIAHKNQSPPLGGQPPQAPGQGNNPRPGTSPAAEEGEQTDKGNPNLMNANDPAKGQGGPTLGYDPKGKNDAQIQQPAPKPFVPLGNIEYTADGKEKVTNGQGKVAVTQLDLPPRPKKTPINPALLKPWAETPQDPKYAAPPMPPPPPSPPPAPVVEYQPPAPEPPPIIFSPPMVYPPVNQGDWVPYGGGRDWIPYGGGDDRWSDVVGGGGARRGVPYRPPSRRHRP